MHLKIRHVASSVDKHLLYKYENQSSGPWNTGKKQNGMAAS